jgi:myo-inositol-1(or 4)-monophosphatase
MMPDSPKDSSKSREAEPIGYNPRVNGPHEHELLAVARQAVSAAASELMDRFGQAARGVHTKSTPTDLASEADLAAESAIREVLGRLRPNDAILAEEGGATGEGELRWLVDPLDGSINFLFGIPAFVVSVACEDRSGTLAGVVFDPIRNERFAATRTGPATLNDVQVAGSDRANLATAMVATGFAYDSAVRARQAAVLERVLPRVRDIRRFGSAAMDLSWCACGRWDAYFERGVNAWDVGAGALIAARAGLEVRDLPAVGELPAGLVAAPGGIIEELYDLVAR